MFNFHLGKTKKNNKSFNFKSRPGKLTTYWGTNMILNHMSSEVNLTLKLKGKIQKQFGSDSECSMI